MVMELSRQISCHFHMNIHIFLWFFLLLYFFFKRRLPPIIAVLNHFGFDVLLCTHYRNNQIQNKKLISVLTKRNAFRTIIIIICFMVLLSPSAFFIHKMCYLTSFLCFFLGKKINFQKIDLFVHSNDENRCTMCHRRIHIINIYSHHSHNKLI